MNLQETHKLRKLDENFNRQPQPSVVEIGGSEIKVYRNRNGFYRAQMFDGIGWDCEWSNVLPSVAVLNLITKGERLSKASTPENLSVTPN